MVVDYLVNGNNFKRYGVYVESSTGVLDALKLKPPIKANWPDSHGSMIGIARRLYEEREITLSCFIVAENNDLMIKQFNAFIRNFSQRFMESNQDLQQLIIDIDHPTRPLIFMVHLSEGISLQKKWREGRQIGVFTLKLVEPEPVKIVYEKVVTDTESDADITFQISSQKGEYRYNVYWGETVGGVAQTDKDIFTEMGFAFPTHNYAQKGRYYIVMTGDVDDASVTITNTDNARQLWEIFH